MKIVHVRSREMLRVLDDTIIFGVHANLPYLKAILTHPEFVQGTMTTQFIQTHFPEGLERKELTALQKEFSDKALGLVRGGTSTGAAMSSTAALDLPWRQAWRFV